MACERNVPCWLPLIEVIVLNIWAKLIQELKIALLYFTYEGCKNMVHVRVSVFFGHL